MAFAPTAEQADIIDAARTEQDMIIEAGAGTGKTTTLRQLAEDSPKERILYVAYNKSVQLEAADSFSPNVTARTAHSLAYGGTIRKYGNRVRNCRMGSIQVTELAQRLNICDFDFGPDSNDKPLKLQVVAELVTTALTRFCGGADQEVSDRHVSRRPGLGESENEALRAHVVELANRAWSDYSSTSGRLTFTPAIYLKLWQSSNPTLKYDTIFFDEAQDANGAMAAVVNRQSAKRRAVGDRCQALYEWNGAIDAMARWSHWSRLMLTRSFRFGPVVAGQANLWLEYLKSDLRLTGLESIDSRLVEYMSEPTAVLCRTNMGVIDAALRQLQAGRATAVVGGVGEAARLARAAADLKSGRRPKHPDLAGFRSWEEFLNFVNHDPDGQDFAVLAALVETYGTDQILMLQRRLCAKEADAQVTISTGHKAKGREWPKVLIAQDFAPRDSDSDSEDSPEPPFTRAAAMLAYVAVTRARDELCLGPLTGVL